MGAILIVLILSILGTVSLNLAAQEIESLRAVRDDAVARHLAEAGADLVVQWFHDPRSSPPAKSGGTPGSLFVKQYDLPESGPSFFDANGVSQFTGTSEHPDLLYDAARPEHDRLLNDPITGWFRALRALGRVLKLKVYGPTSPRLLCTVEVTAGVGGLTRTVAVQLGARAIPPLRAGAQLAGNGTGPVPGGSPPIWLHWGDLRLRGEAHLGKRNAIPTKTVMAPVTGQSYAQMSHPEDRWLDIWVGGSAFFDPAVAVEPPPSNVYPQQDPFPGLKEDRWDYESLKKQARLYGAYYARDREGLLYRNGMVIPGQGLTADAVFGSESVGDHHGLVFVDTLDQLPPNPTNLGTLMLDTEYAEGLFIVNGHLILKPKGTGKSVPVLSPPSEGFDSLGSRVPVDLSGIHVQGVLYAAGDIAIEGHPRIYGALIAGGQVLGGSGTSTGSGSVEVWYNYDLRSGLSRGMPVVYVAPGTWQEKY